MLVKADRLSRAPKAFQDYVKDHFLKMEIFGIKCYVAIKARSFKRNFYGGRPNPEGVCPSHSADMSEYKEGLPKDLELSEWVKRELKKKNSFIFEFSKSWDDGCISSMVGDH